MYKEATKITKKSKVDSAVVKNSKVKYLSESIIWKQMQKYYKDLGPTAWQQDIVPYQITSNKIIAHLYAALINSILLDHGSMNNQEPFYILELGSGHGKFSFYLCKFLEILNLYDKFNIVYIASDISLKNIESWKSHPQLQKYIKAQQLDFACFDASLDQEIFLINSNKIITQSSLNNNLIVIANYVFDTLAHDAFKINNHKVFASSINLQYKNKFCLQKIKYKYSHKLIDPKNYYNNSIFNEILLEYQKQLKQGIFLLPVGALNAISNIQRFSEKSTFFLVADKGNININDFRDRDNSSIATHGSVSFMVNFHAISRFLDLNQGLSIMSPNAYTDLQIACFISNNHDNHNRFLEFGFKQVLYDVNPLHLINLCYYNDNINNWGSLQQILAVLSLSKWDPDLFYDLSEQLLQFINKSLKTGNLDVEQEKDLEQGLELISAYFFKLSKNQDISFAIGNIYYILEKFDLAIENFKLSLLHFESTVEVWYNIALCYYAKKNMRLARKYLSEALKLNSKYSAAKKLLSEI